MDIVYATGGCIYERKQFQNIGRWVPVFIRIHVYRFYIPFNFTHTRGRNTILYI